MTTYPWADYPGEALKRSRFRATGEFRAPKKGEWYLSGAIVEAYRAPNDLGTAYHIAKPVEMQTCRCCNGSGRVAVEE